MADPRVDNISDNGYSHSVQIQADFHHGKEIQKGLGRVLVGTVTGIDNFDGRKFFELMELVGDGGS